MYSPPLYHISPLDPGAEKGVPQWRGNGLLDEGNALVSKPKTTSIVLLVGFSCDSYRPRVGLTNVIQKPSVPACIPHFANVFAKEFELLTVRQVA